MEMEMGIGGRSIHARGWAPVLWCRASCNTGTCLGALKVGHR